MTMHARLERQQRWMELVIGALVVGAAGYIAIIGWLFFGG